LMATNAVLTRPTGLADEHWGQSTAGSPRRGLALPRRLSVSDVRWLALALFSWLAFRAFVSACRDGLGDSIA
jgi:hypothetical protein